MKKKILKKTYPDNNMQNQHRNKIYKAITKQKPFKHKKLQKL